MLLYSVTSPGLPSTLFVGVFVGLVYCTGYPAKLSYILFILLARLALSDTFPLLGLCKTPTRLLFLHPKSGKLKLLPPKLYAPDILFSKLIKFVTELLIASACAIKLDTSFNGSAPARTLSNFLPMSLKKPPTNALGLNSCPQRVQLTSGNIAPMSFIIFWPGPKKLPNALSSILGIAIGSTGLPQKFNILATCCASDKTKFARLTTLSNLV